MGSFGRASDLPPISKASRAARRMHNERGATPLPVRLFSAPIHECHAEGKAAADVVCDQRVSRAQAELCRTKANVGAKPPTEQARAVAHAQSEADNRRHRGLSRISGRIHHQPFGTE